MNKTDQFVAVVLAADRTTEDPITKHTGAACKAFAPVGGTPMIVRVLDALEASERIKSTIICGPSESLLSHCPELQQRIEAGLITWLPNLDSPSRSAESAFAQIALDTPILLTTADHALLTSEIVQHFLEESVNCDKDVTVGLANYQDILAAFPGAKRTVTKFRDGGFCGCNLFTFNRQGRNMVKRWRQAEELRKRPWRLIAEILGPWSVLMYLLGFLTLDKAMQSVSVRTGIRVQAVVLPYARAGVDVDKVEDLLLAERVLLSPSPDDGNSSNHQ
jgi:GTP:adenosylcobinamide-phosphate guanylyltransferase